MKYLPPLKSLQFFAVAARLQSFKLAAEELYVTQAAVSQQIKQLEQQLQLALFHRQGRQTRLTESGSQLLPYVQSAFDTLERGVSSVMDDPRPQTLCISALHSLTSMWLIPRLHGFQAMYPELMVQLVPSNALVDFTHDEIDLAIRMGKGGYGPLQERFLLQEKLILVASPQLIEKIDGGDPQQVMTLPWLKDTCMEKAFLLCCEQFSIDADSITPILSSDNAMPLIAAAIEGQGVALVNQGMVAEQVLQGQLMPLLDFICDS